MLDVASGFSACPVQSNRIEFMGHADLGDRLAHSGPKDKLDFGAGTW